MKNFKNVEIDEEYSVFDVFEIKKRVVWLKGFCVDCGKEIRNCYTRRCHSCATTESWKNPTEKQLESAREICRKLGKLSKTPKQIEASRENVQKMLKHPNTIAVLSENGQKMGPINGRKTIKYAQEANWKGGISTIPFKKGHGMTPEEWQKLAQSIRKRDHFICQYCGKKNSTSVHHISPRRVKIDNHPDNLITLCKNCHPKVERLTDTYLKKNKDPIEIFYEKWSL